MDVGHPHGDGLRRCGSLGPHFTPSLAEVGYGFTRRDLVLHALDRLHGGYHRDAGTHDLRYDRVTRPLVRREFDFLPLTGWVGHGYQRRLRRGCIIKDAELA